MHISTAIAAPAAPRAPNLARPPLPGALRCFRGNARCSARGSKISSTRDRGRPPPAQKNRGLRVRWPRPRRGARGGGLGHAYATRDAVASATHATRDAVAAATHMLRAGRGGLGHAC